MSLSWRRPLQREKASRAPIPAALHHSASDSFITSSISSSHSRRPSLVSPSPSASSSSSSSYSPPAATPISLSASVSSASLVFDVEVVVYSFLQLDDTSKPKSDKWSTLSPKLDRLSAKSEVKKMDQKSLFVEQVANIIAELDEQRMKTPSSTWSTLFFKRSDRCKDILPHEKLLHYKDVISRYMRILNKRQLKEDNPTAVIGLRVADRLLEFLNTHDVDPDSCLIGLPPSEEAMSIARRYMDLSTPASIATSAQQPLSPRVAPPSYQQVVAHIMDWATIEKEQELREKIDALCTTFRGVHNLVKGDIAVINMSAQLAPRLQQDDSNNTSNVFIYARHTGAVKTVPTNMWEFFVSPDENVRVMVEGKHIYPITPHMKITTKDPNKINSLVQNPAEQFSQLLRANIFKEVDDFLAKQGVDVSLVRSSSDENFELKYLPDIRKALGILQNLLDHPPEHFYKEMGFYARALVSAHTRKLAANPTFTHLLSRESTINSLRIIANAPLAQSKIKAYATVCKANYENMDNKAKDILSGAKKRQMTDWWLEKIESSAEQFLCKRQFDFAAVPANYILEKPADMKVVRENLRIIEEIMHSPAGDSMSATPLIESLKSEIYPVIDRFIQDSIIVLADIFEVEMEGKILPKIIEKIREQKVQTQTDKKELFEQINMLVQDLKYLDEMKKLENVQTSEKMLHIVPIGGLVLNNFLRQWNELKTVIELWGQEPEPEESHNNNHNSNNNSSHNNNALEHEKSERSLLHQKVVDSDCDAVAKILKDGGGEMLNSQDPFGWTPLHGCCHSGNVEICKLLLKQPRVAVTVKNRDGNTALHYLVRHADCKEVLQMMLAKNADPNAINSHQETPLHYACMRGHEDNIATLLNCGADASAVNIDGDSCLHYAVYVGKPEVVRLLLKHGANRDVFSKKHGKPLDIAVKFKLSEIADMLRSDENSTTSTTTPATTTTTTTTNGTHANNNANHNEANGDNSNGHSVSNGKSNGVVHLEVANNNKERRRKSVN